MQLSKLSITSKIEFQPLTRPLAMCRQIPDRIFSAETDKAQVQLLKSTSVSSRHDSSIKNVEESGARLLSLFISRDECFEFQNLTLASDQSRCSFWIPLLQLPQFSSKKAESCCAEIRFENSNSFSTQTSKTDLRMMLASDLIVVVTRWN